MSNGNLPVSQLKAFAVGIANAVRQGLSQLPAQRWLASYNRQALSSDVIAAVIVTIMLIPQSLAYALLAGLPPQMGLYASILPLLAYAAFGTSRTLAVGPVAVISLMTAAAIGQVAAPGTAEYITAAITLAFLSGVLLLALGLFRLGFLANFLSHPVISGFITASAILIATSQLKHLLGIKVIGQSMPAMLNSLWSGLGRTNFITLTIGIAVTAFLFWSRKGLKPRLSSFGMSTRAADIAARAAPVAAIIATIMLVWIFDLKAHGVAIVGTIPYGLPPLVVPSLESALVVSLLPSAILISIVGFVESISVAQTLAARRRQRIDPDQELNGLGAANLAAAVSGGFPVTGGFSRSIVNFDAGAETPAASALTAAGILLATLILTPLLYFLPLATLAATIIVAVLSLVDFAAIRRAWAYSRSDFSAMLATILVTLGFGVEPGILAGVALSLLLYLYRTSRPHIAIVGQVPGTDHFRNVLGRGEITSPQVLSLRIDESLYFANARFLEDSVYDLVAARPATKHVVFMCSAINHIDASALESLEAINLRLKDAGVEFHLSEVKGPVLARLSHTHFLKSLTGKVFMSQYSAMEALDPVTTARAHAQPSQDRDGAR